MELPSFYFLFALSSILGSWPTENEEWVLLLPTAQKPCFFIFFIELKDMKTSKMTTLTWSWTFQRVTTSFCLWIPWVGESVYEREKEWECLLRVSVSVPGQGPAPKFLIKYCEERGSGARILAFSVLPQGWSPHSTTQILPAWRYKNHLLSTHYLPWSIGSSGFLSAQWVSGNLEVICTGSYEVPGFLVKPTRADAEMGRARIWEEAT